MPFTAAAIAKINEGISAYVSKQVSAGRIPADKQDNYIAKYQQMAGVAPKTVSKVEIKLDAKGEKI